MQHDQSDFFNLQSTVCNIHANIHSALLFCFYDQLMFLIIDNNLFLTNQFLLIISIDSPLLLSWCHTFFCLSYFSFFTLWRFIPLLPNVLIANGLLLSCKTEIDFDVPRLTSDVLGHTSKYLLRNLDPDFVYSNYGSVVRNQCHSDVFGG